MGAFERNKMISYAQNFEDVIYKQNLQEQKRRFLHRHWGE
jgi:hypothetical protein